LQPQTLSAVPVTSCDADNVGALDTETTSHEPDSFSRVDLAAMSDEAIRRKFPKFPVGRPLLQGIPVAMLTLCRTPVAAILQVQVLILYQWCAGAQGSR